MPTQMVHTDVCFVIMPFGSKPVGDRKVNFDFIYDEILKPAISSVELPEGGKLRAARTDKDFFTGDIGQEMFEYLHWSRFAVADLSGLNPNVMYELGIRHAARESGTALFRQTNAPIPFDVNHIKVFSYSYRPKKNAQEARKLVRRVLRESLAKNRLDSPVQIALRAQRQTPDAAPFLMEVENALRRFDRPAAIASLRGALVKTGGNALIHMRLGLLLREQGDSKGALEQFDAAIALQPNYGEAWREKGILQGRLTQDQGANRLGEAAIRKAIEINPTDFDALASLGGFMRRDGRLDEARAMYEKAAEVSGGHPYPLLMALKLRARGLGKLEIGNEVRRQLRQAERMRRAQADQEPPLDSPWCFFDVAEVRLYSNDGAGFLEWLSKGVDQCDQRWQAETFRSALRILLDGGVKPDGLDAGLTKLDVAISNLPE